MINVTVFKFVSPLKYTFIQIVTQQGNWCPSRGLENRLQAQGLVTNNGGGGGATKLQNRSGGAREVLPLRKGMGTDKVLAMLKGTVRKVLG